MIFMESSPASEDDVRWFRVDLPRSLSLTPIQVFDNLQRTMDPKTLEERAREVNERVHAQHEKAQRRLAELVSFVLSIAMSCMGSHVCQSSDRLEFDSPSYHLIHQRPRRTTDTKRLSGKNIQPSAWCQSRPALYTWRGSEKGLV